MIYEEILTKDGASILITGDSLSYNRYSYDDTPRENAYDCGAGMPSWAFTLRDRIYTSDSQFTFGSDLSFSCKTVRGIDNNSSVPHTAMFGGQIQTLFPDGDVSFVVPIQSNQIVLYLQKRLDSACVIDIWVDGQLASADVCLVGDVGDFAGYALCPIVLSCDSNRMDHTVVFTNIRGKTPKITVAGVGSQWTDIALSGKGNQCVRFFVDNFEERIGKYHPDLAIVILSANDRGRTTAHQLQADTEELFSMLFQAVPTCKLLFLLPPSSHDPLNPDSSVVPYTSLSVEEAYYRTVEKVCKDFAERGFDVDTMRVSSLFSNEEVAAWRYDNIHLNQCGNSILGEAVSKRLGLI